MSPRIESEPGRELREAWIYLSEGEAEELRLALNERATSDFDDPGWHVHVTDSIGREVSLAVDDIDDPAFASWFVKPPDDGS